MTGLIVAVVVLALAALFFGIMFYVERGRADRRAATDAQTITTLTREQAEASASAASLKEQLQSEREASLKQTEMLRNEFKVLAAEVLTAESDKFKVTNKEAMQILLKPFGDNLRDFKERVEKIHSDDLAQRGALRNEIENLQKLNHQITSETANLTRALKGDPKYQGDWGEMVLETILEGFNFQRGVHYKIQENFKDENGKDARPDVVLNLPGGKQIIIDSKVSLTSFVGYVGAATDSERKGFLKAHLDSTRRHVEELSRKDYQNLLDKGRTPDFVIMFMPNEPAFLAALQSDAALWEEAYRKNVIIASPTNLFALLKIVDDLWRRDAQSKNMVDIADEGAKLYDKVAGFVEQLTNIGVNLDRAHQSYDTALKQLSTGSGNIIGRCEKLRDLGVKAKKQIKLVAQEQDNDSEPTPTLSE